MTVRNPQKSRQNENLLVDALDSFNSTISDLGSSYHELKTRIEDLNVQISEKNQQLEEKFYKVNRLRWFFDSILNSMTDGVVVIDTAGKIVLFNKGAEVMTGYLCEDVISKAYTKVFGRQVSERFSPIFTLKHAAPLFLEEKEMKTKTGRLLPVRYSTALVTDSQERTLGAVEVFSDLTMIKRLENEMQQVKTHMALNQMAGLVAHEIRNPLGGIRGYVDLLAESLDSKDQRRDMVQNIIQSINRLEEIVANFLHYTRPVKPQFQLIDLMEYLSDILTYFEKETDLKSKNIHLVKDLTTGNGAIQVRIDPILLEQAIIVVLDNSIKALHMGGTLRVEIQSVPSLSEHSKGNASIIISDTGEGMSKQVLKKLFVPFFTTRERGLGLGLALAKNFISLHHGDIFIESEKDMGTTVTIALPKS